MGTGDLASLSGLTKLKHIDFAASQMVGGVANLNSATVEYANFASSSGIGGDLKDLPKELKYGNFRAARYLKGDLKTLTKGDAGTNQCKLIELDISGAAKGNIFGQLENTGGDKDSLIDRCA